MATNLQPSGSSWERVRAASKSRAQSFSGYIRAAITTTVRPSRAAASDTEREGRMPASLVVSNPL